MLLREAFPEIRLEPMPRGTLLYDGECGFCSRSVLLFERIARRPFNKRPSADVLETLPDEVARTATGQMLWRDADGSLWGGSAAVLRALNETGWPVLAWLLGNAVTRPVTRLAYRIVSRYRHRFSRPVTMCPLAHAKK